MTLSLFCDSLIIAVLRERGSAVAHCPLSNFFFGDGSLDVRRLMDKGNKVGLGTDVAGGYSPSMLSAMRTAVLAHQAVSQWVNCVWYKMWLGHKTLVQSVVSLVDAALSKNYARQ